MGWWVILLLETGWKVGDVECKGAVRSSVTAPTFLIQTKYNDSYALLGELASCGSTDKQTCLKTVVLLTDNKKNVSASTPSLSSISGSCVQALSALCTLDISCRWWPSNQVAVCCSMKWRCPCPMWQVSGSAARQQSQMRFKQPNSLGQRGALCPQADYSRVLASGRGWWHATS